MSYIQEIEKIIQDIVPERAGLTKIELLGPNIAIYVKHPEVIYEESDVVKNLASTLKRKVLIRTDPDYLMKPEEARKIIKEIVGEEAGIKNIYFDPLFSDVYIEALKPGIVIGKDGTGLKEIMLKTKWSPIVLRYPTMPSSTLEGIRKSIISNAQERKKFLTKVGKKIAQPLPQTTWIRAGMLGAFREVGRSALFIQTKNSKILLDCGVNQASSKPEDMYPYLNLLGFPLSELDAVVISHAHTDHIGFLPFLFAAGYDGPVYMTPPTRELTALLQRDYINVVKKYLNMDPPYGKKEIQEELKHIITVPYGEVVDITPEVKLTFYNAGHILGSAITHLHIGEGKHNIIYTGDMKFGFTHLFNPAHINFPRAETIFIESTYGKKTDILPSRRESDEALINVIKETVENKGHVLIPVFSVGRSQEILLVLEHYAREHEWNIPVWIDGMILEASAIHTAYPDYLKNSLKKRILSNDSPFEWDEIKLAYGKDKKEIVDGEPSVILAPSGMLTGGPSVEYLKLLAEDERNTLVFVGYQSASSLGAKIQQGVKEVPIIDDNGKAKTLKINMRVETVEGFSGHSDRKQLIAWLGNISVKPRVVYTMHGDYNKTAELAHYISRKFGIHADAPLNMEFRRLR